MIKHNFKLGDKVKLKEGVHSPLTCEGKILTIIAFVDNYIFVTYPGISYDYFPLYSDEIEHIKTKKGKQLMFQFMNELPKED